MKCPRYAHGRVLALRVESDTYPIHAAGLRADFARDADVPFIDAAAILDPKDGRLSVFLLNRDLQEERDVMLVWHDPQPQRVLACQTLTGPDLKAFNTFANPNRVAPQPLDAPPVGPNMTLRLPPRSHSVIQFATG